MLKWAVNGARQSYLPSIGENPSFTDGLSTTKSISTRRSMSSIGTSSGISPSPGQRKKIRRKSSDITSLRYNLRSNNKENCLTSTPLAAVATAVTTLRRNNNSPHLMKLGSLKDLSNIQCENSPIRNQKNETLLANQQSQSHPVQYASTLPTFDVEYSPCALVPGPILALRGIGIADTYFEKPRYLSHEFKESNQKENKSIRRQQRQQQQQQQQHSNTTTPSAGLSATATTTTKWENIKTLQEEDSSLSSSRMGDMTLERMIDAILESARKERKIPKFSKHTTPRRPPIVMSPTYTPADDPASDLNEFWDAQNEKYQQHNDNVEFVNQQFYNVFNEREVRSPNSKTKNNIEDCKARMKDNNDDDDDEEISFHLQRQRAVRRKRKFSEIRNSVVKDPLKVMENVENNLSKRRCNISPDSGRNSFSELEDSGGDNTTVTAVYSNCSTKRRLSFSINDLGDI